MKKTIPGKKVTSNAARRKVVAKKVVSSKRRWTAQEIKLLRKLYPSNSNQMISSRLRRPLSGVIAQAFHLGLRKTARRLAIMGRENIALRWGPRRKVSRRKARR